MKKIILTIILACMVIVGCGTPKSQIKGGCRLKVDTTDSFTQDRIKETRQQTLTMSGIGLGISTYVAARTVNDDTYIVLEVMSPSMFSFHKDDTFMLRFDDGSVMELAYGQNGVANYSSVSRSSIWRLKTFLKLSPSQIDILKQKDIDKIRIHFSDSYFDDDVKDLRRDNIAEALECISAY